ncbi:MAG TPA: hypothetical protein PLD20_12085 [Blastocatellia bacterium]|nr:hypothetical protein [Blastocatellia bacterium]HMV82611.1 hypothetical protein [Blastocatellia bacterium]HMY71992.1 hypothetical protein [Blastocatellia bacterium]HMZ18664.1 hypothetical protein [Blastocatellia bacterium]HNG32951.1 hypothetical protein [Blastocatellia bacterium]
MMEDFSANASALGYFYQSRYALFLLLSRAEADAELCVERLDDISFERDGSAIELLQTKHHIKATASLSDASTALWKTLRVWSAALVENKIRPGETILTLVTTGRAPKDSAAAKLRPHPTRDRDHQAALKILREVADQSDSRTNRPAYEAFRNLSDRQQSELVMSIQLLDASPNILDTGGRILDQLRLSTRPQFLEAVYERIEGWWFNRLIQHLSADSTAPILYRELLDQINDLQEQYHTDNLPIEFLPIEFLDAIAPDEQKLGAKERLFIEQLRLVAVAAPRIRKAINDYYRAFQQRSKWVREDLLLVGELETYERRLVDEWERLFERMKENLGDHAEETTLQHEGRALFNAVEDLELNIRPRCNEPYIMRGSFHLLANQLRVGWHADFVQRLNQLLTT